LVFDVEIGVSQYIADGLNGRWLAKRLGRQALTIYNAIDIDRFRNLVYDTAKIKRELGIPGDGFLIGSVGRLTKQKGYDLLLEATSMAIKKIKQQAVDLNIGKNVIFTGMRPDVNNLLHAFDLFVCSSRWEGLSTALMEAMAVEIPILATDIPGNLELLQPGVSAWFVTAEDSGELARGVIKAHQNPEQNKEFARNAFARLSKFRIEQIAIIHEQLYQLVYLNKKTTRWLNHRKADALINNLLDNISKS
jgi:glycosyltransferase involved in cell wall biosynthesis